MSLLSKKCTDCDSDREKGNLRCFACATITPMLFELAARDSALAELETRQFSAHNATYVA